MTNQDEDEVEDELEALEQEMNPPTRNTEIDEELPKVPESEPQPSAAEIAKGRAARRARERAAERAEGPMLA